MLNVVGVGVPTTRNIKNITIQGDKIERVSNKQRRFKT